MERERDRKKESTRLRNLRSGHQEKPQDHPLPESDAFHYKQGLQCIPEWKRLKIKICLPEADFISFKVCQPSTRV